MLYNGPNAFILIFGKRLMTRSLTLINSLLIVEIVVDFAKSLSYYKEI